MRTLGMVGLALLAAGGLVFTPASAAALPYVLDLPAKARAGVQITGGEEDGVLRLTLTLDENKIGAKVGRVSLSLADETPKKAIRTIAELPLAVRRDKGGKLVAHFRLERKLAAVASFTLELDQERDVPGGTHYVFALDEFLDLFGDLPAWKLRRKLQRYGETTPQRETAPEGEGPRPSRARPEDAGREAAIRAIRAYGGDVTFDERGRVRRVNLVYREEPAEDGEFPPCPGTSDEILRHLPNLPEVKELLLHGSQATDRGMRHVARLKGLERLWMWDARVSDAGVAELAGLSNLRYLHISDAGLTDRSLATLAGLGQLEGLALQGNRFTDAGLRELRKLRRLRELMVGLGRGAVTDEGVAALGEVGTLRRLDLQKTQVTDRGLEGLRRLKGLRSLWVQGTAVTPEAIRRLEESVPGLKVNALR